MPLPLTVSCFSNIQIGFTFLVPADPGSPGKGPLNVCVCKHVEYTVDLYGALFHYFSVDSDRKFITSVSIWQSRVASLWLGLQKIKVKNPQNKGSLLGKIEWLQKITAFNIHSFFAFSVLTLLVGRQEEHPACKNWVMRCWCGYLSGARCKLFAHGPADATASQNRTTLLPHLNPDWFYLSSTGLPRLSRKRGFKRAW